MNRLLVRGLSLLVATAIMGACTRDDLATPVRGAEI